jgi:hypothetical protein
VKKVIIGLLIAGAWLYFTLPKIQYQGDKGPATVTIVCEDIALLQDVALFTTDEENNEFPCLTQKFQDGPPYKRTCELDGRGKKFFLIKHKEKQLGRFKIAGIPSSIFLSRNLEIVNSWVPRSAQITAKPETAIPSSSDEWNKPVEVSLAEVPRDARIESFVLDELPWGFSLSQHMANKGGAIQFSHRLGSGQNWIVARELGEKIIGDVRACGDVLSVAKINVKKVGSQIPESQPLRMNVTDFIGQKIQIDQSAIPQAKRKGAIAFALFPTVFDIGQSYQVWGQNIVQDRQLAEDEIADLSLIFEGGRVAVYYPELERFWIGSSFAPSNENLIKVKIGKLAGSLQIDVKGLLPEYRAKCSLQLSDTFNQHFQFSEDLNQAPGGSKNFLRGQQIKAISMNADGRFQIPNIPAGPYSLELFSGSQTLGHAKVVVESDGKTQFVFEL